MLAMLYLVLFSGLALGFYASVNSAIQIGDNEADVSRARLAAESGQEFMRINLARVAVYEDPHPHRAFQAVAAQLAYRFDGTPNLRGGRIAVQGAQVRFPASDYVDGDGAGGEFRVVVGQAVQGLRVSAYGRERGGAVTRCVRLDYARGPANDGILDYGVVSRGVVTMESNAHVTGTPAAADGGVLVTSAASPAMSIGTNGSVSGVVALVHPTAVATAGSSVIQGGVSYGVEEPEFPRLDTSPFRPYAVNVISGKNVQVTAGTVRNVYVKANSNPTFTGGTVEGVVYIETPNKVTFDSNQSIRGVIVVQNDPTGDPSTNQLIFRSNTGIYGVETLPATKDFPAALREMTGSIILAPTFGVHFSSNFGVAGGCVVADEVNFDSNSVGTIAGTVIALGGGGVRMAPNTNITVDASRSATPAGMTFTAGYRPIASTYDEAKD